MAKKKISTKDAICSHTVENYSTMIPNQRLTPINGKIYWHIVEETLDMEKYKVIYAFDKAFKVWQNYMLPIVFEATGDITKAQIKISFLKNGDSRLPSPFSQGVLAYAYAPSGTSLGIQSDMFFNDAYRWDEIHKPDAINLFKVVVHELFHTLNGGHSTDITDITYPRYQPDNNVVVTLDTQKFIYDTYKQYGVKNPAEVIPTPSNPTPSAGNTLSLKLLFKSKGDLARLSTSQIDVLNEYLEAGIIRTDKPQTKINKIWLAISNS